MKYHFFIGEKNWEKQLFLRYVCDCLIEKENWCMVNDLEELSTLADRRNLQTDGDELIIVDTEIAPTGAFGDDAHYFILTNLAQDNLEKCKVAYNIIREKGAVSVILMSMPYGCKINGNYVTRFLEKGNKIGGKSNKKEDQDRAVPLSVYEIELDERDAKILIEDDHSSIRRPHKLSKGYQYALKEVVKTMTDKKFSKWPNVRLSARNNQVRLHNAFGIFGMK